MYLLSEPTFKPLRVYSDGAGTQSVAVMVLQAQGKLPKPFDVFVFANVGDDSENPETIAYRREYVLPFAERHGLALVERQRIYKGQPISLLEFVKQEKKSVSLPVYFADGGKGNRSCTQEHKIEVVRKYLAYERKPSHVELGIGFSVEEGYRTSKKYPYWHDRYWSRDSKTGNWKPGKKLGFWQKYDYPLAQLRMSKADCKAIVREAMGVQPPESLCWFCPFTERGIWMDRKTSDSPLYHQAIEFEEMLNDKYQSFRTGIHKSKRIGLYPDRIPLREIGTQYTIWEQYMDTDEKCQVGVCGL